MTEWQAYYQLEPFGSLIDDERHGVAVAALANINRDSKTRPEPYKSSDFMTWRNLDKVDVGPILMQDVEAQSDLIKRKIFKIKT